MKKLFIKGQIAKNNIVSKVNGAIASTKGEGYVDTGVKILMAVVIGGLLLSGLYAFFKGIIMPSMESKIIEMFNYKG